MKKRRDDIAIGVLILCLVTFIVAIVLIKQEIPTDKELQEKEIQSFIACANSTGLILYGKTNSQMFENQRKELGALFDSIHFVDCSFQREQCEGIMLIPAWRLNDQIYYGSFSKDILIKLMGCE